MTIPRGVQLPDAVPPTKALAAKLAQVITAVSGVAKSGRNDFHNYDYATIADVLAAVRTELAERGVAIQTSVHSYLEEDGMGRKKDQTRATVVLAVSFVDSETGDVCTSWWPGQGMDAGDKAYYKAFSGSIKYAMLQTFLIPTGIDPEANSEHDRQDGQAQRQQGPPQQRPQRNGQRAPRPPQKKAPVPKRVIAPMFADQGRPAPWEPVDPKYAEAFIDHATFAELCQLLKTRAWRDVQSHLGSEFGVSELHELPAGAAAKLLHQARNSARSESGAAA